MNEQEQSLPPGLKVPLDTVDADQLPRSEPLNYELVCYLVGDMYIENVLARRAQREQFEAVTTQLRELADGLKVENDMLKKELAKHEGIRERTPPSQDSVGPREGHGG